MFIPFLLFQLCISSPLLFWHRKAPFPQPIDPYNSDPNDLRTPPTLLADFKAYLTYSYSTGCQSIWTRQEFPQGNQFEQEFPSTLVRGFFDSDTTLTAFVLYNEYLKSIVISFRPSSTSALWKYDYKFWRSKFSSNEFNQSFSSTHLNVSLPLNMVNASSPDFLSSSRILKEREFSREEEMLFPKGLAVHHGFKMLYLVFRNEILLLTNELAAKFPDYKVVFCGHSLGASLAELAAVDFALNGNAPDRLWLFPFASPRTGNRNWDPFPQLPFRVLNYGHIGQEYIIWENNTITKCPRNPDGTMECRLHANIFKTNPNIHAPRFYMKFLDLAFNCSAPANEPDATRELQIKEALLQS